MVLFGPIDPTTKRLPTSVRNALAADLADAGTPEGAAVAGVAGAGVADATTTTKGKIQLAGDLAGTAAAPTVPGLATKITAFADPNADRIVFWDDSAGAFVALAHSAPLTITGTTLSIATATESAVGVQEFATAAETITGASNALSVHPAGLLATRGLYVGVNAQTGTTYAPVLTDQGKLVTLSNAAAITVTLPSDATTAFTVGTQIDFAGIGAGLVTFVAGASATVNGTPSLVTRAQYSTVTAIKYAANTWLLVGDLA